MRLTLIALALGQLGGAQIWEKPIGPGLVYRMEVDATTPRLTHVLRYSPTSAWADLRAELGQGTVFTRREVPSRESIDAMVRRTGAIGGVNGGYFAANGDPIGLIARDGEPKSAPYPNRSVFAWGAGLAQFTIAGFDAWINLPAGRFPLDGLNEESNSNRLVLSTAAAGVARGKPGSVHAILQLDGPLPPNGEVSGSVVALIGDQTDVPVGPNQAVLTGLGPTAERILPLRVNDRIKLEIRIGGLNWSRVAHAIGGGPHLLRGGRVVVDGSAQGFGVSHTNRRHPRTAVGQTARGDLVMVVVDGRQPMSDGATLPEMAAILRRLGCVDAINLDGGGSSTFSLFGEVLNRPSDGSPRPVSDGLILLRRDAPVANPLQLTMRTPGRLLVGQDFDFRAYENGAPLPHRRVLWSASGSGWIDQGGRLRPFREGPVRVRAYSEGRAVEWSGVVQTPSP